MTADGKLLAIDGRDGHFYYFFADNEDSSAIYWTIGNNATELFTFAEVAGGFNVVDGEVEGDTTTFTYDGVEYYFDGSKFTPDVVGELAIRSAFWRFYNIAGDDYYFAVNEDGELIAKNIPNEGQDDYMMCCKHLGQISIDMQDNITTAEVVSSIIELWGVELITEMTVGATGSFVLPATDDILAQTYQLDYGQIAPKMSEYSE